MIDKVDWYGCYDGSWQSAPLTPEAFSHPAKVPFALAERIYRHMLAEGWLSPGNRVIDPFGGIAGCGFHAVLYGMEWTGVELEARFHALGNQNLALWRDRYAAHFSGYGTGRLLLGDSRRLQAVIREADAVISSPSYAETRIDGNGDEGASGLRSADGEYLRGPDGWAQRKAMGARYGQAPGNLGNLPAGDVDAVVSSPPYAESLGNAGHSGIDWSKQADRDTTHAHGWNGTGYSQTAAATNTPGQLGAMPTGDIDAVVGSPPYAGTSVAPTSVQGSDAGKLKMNEGQTYPATPGQLGAMPAGNPIDGIVSSPPYGANTVHGQAGVTAEGFADPGRVGKRSTAFTMDDYGDSADNLGNAAGETFWQAARQIVEQCYAVLKPGGYAAWITGDYVRDKRRVLFGEQWLALCQAVGFEPVLWAVAWKSETHGAQADIFGELVERKTSKVSFFRRLANRNNPAAAIENEDVIFVRKPGGLAACD